MYNKGDGTFKSQPKFMSENIVDNILKKTLSHCVDNNLPSFMFAFHGGEPLLASKQFYKDFVAKCNAMFLLKGIQPVYSMQTNGMLITDEWCNLFEELEIYASISIDGDKSTHDDYRIDFKGKGTYDRVIKGLRRLQRKFQGIDSYKVNLLSVINTKADPIEQYEHFRNLGGINNVDFLFPDSNYEYNEIEATETPIADYLIPIFDRWFCEEEKTIGIRLFKTFINMILGFENFSTDSYGSLENKILVIETDGAIESVDVLKICGHGFTKNDYNILWNDLEDALQEPLIDLYYYSHVNLCDQCKSCPLSTICGGGYLPHRYSKLNGFDNPSVYCKDLAKLICHIQNSIVNEFPNDVRELTGINPLNWDQLHAYVSQYQSPQKTATVVG
jgi:uncharacterized protein